MQISLAMREALRRGTVKGLVLYRGPSALDGAEIVLIASGFTGSRNSKTGAGLVQTYILRADMAPGAAVKAGADASICGDCPHRGDHDETGALISGTRSCYVNLAHGPRSVFEAFKRDVYADATAYDPATVSAIFAGRQVRLGTYGDPAAIPVAIWRAIMARAVGGTGYTHQQHRFPEFAEWCMASADTPEAREAAKGLGFRTFRVAPRQGWAKLPGEVLCPASAEAGYKTTCDACKACGGHSAKARADIVIPLHGVMARAAERRQIVRQ